MSNNGALPTQSHPSHVASNVDVVPLPPSSEARHYLFSNHPDPPSAHGQRDSGTYDDPPPPYTPHAQQPVLNVDPGFPPPHMEVGPQRRLMRNLGERFGRGVGVALEGVRGFLGHWPMRRFGRLREVIAGEPQHVQGDGIEGRTGPPRYQRTRDAVVEVPTSARGR